MGFNHSKMLAQLAESMRACARNTQIQRCREEEGMEQWERGIPGGCEAPVAIMNAMDAARAVPLANQPGPNINNANTPNAAQPI